MGEIHGGSMLHVLPAGTYGLRPAVNRSNTRTWRATLCIPATGPLLTAARPLSLFRLAYLDRRHFFFSSDLLALCIPNKIVDESKFLFLSSQSILLVALNFIFD